MGEDFTTSVSRHPTSSRLATGPGAKKRTVPSIHKIKGMVLIFMPDLESPAPAKQTSPVFAN